MQFWFARGSEVSIREQLVTQVVLGILSDDLQPGQRPPSTRDLARRFYLHPNTISAGYRQLQRDRWVEFRHPSGNRRAWWAKVRIAKLTWNGQPSHCALRQYALAIEDFDSSQEASRPPAASNT